MKTKIKKAAVGVVAAAMVLTVGATSALAAAPEYGRNFVDADHDGICDSVGSSYRYIDADNDGLCDNRGKNKLAGTGSGRDFVDADGDGICDNYGARKGRGYCGGRNQK